MSRITVAFTRMQGLLSPGGLHERAAVHLSCAEHAPSRELLLCSPQSGRLLSHHIGPPVYTSMVVYLSGLNLLACMHPGPTFPLMLPCVMSQSHLCLVLDIGCAQAHTRSAIYLQGRGDDGRVMLGP